jgi:UDP-glucose 4-epimerase
METVVVTGVAGFIGSNLADHLLAKGYKVLGLDNFSTGKTKFLESANNHPNFKLIVCDLSDINSFQDSLSGYDCVFHLAANADVRFGLEHPRKDLEQNTLVTFNVLEAMRVNNIKKIVYSSTGSIYGESQIIPTPEDCPMPIQTSLYAASKISCESMIQAYCEGFEFQSWIFRFVSVLGERYTHGHVIDFYSKLKKNPNKLHVLGNGHQQKSYIYIQDCILGMMIGVEKADNKINIFNLGTEESIEVLDSIEVIKEFMNVQPEIITQNSIRGWVGDNPLILLDINKIKSLGWMPKLSIRNGIQKTLEWLENNKWFFEDLEK